MIFRALYRRRLRAHFREFVPEEMLADITKDVSEWQAFQRLLPIQLTSTAKERSEATIEVQRMIERALAERRHDQ